MPAAPAIRHERLAILTSGGDAPGMNPAIRAVVRTALDRGVEVVAVSEGLRGLVSGGEHFRPMDWESVGGILHLGGTVIGSARCPEFRSLEGRQAAVRNLIEHGVSRLIVIGGDGSLTAAHLLHREWHDHVAALIAAGRLSTHDAEARPGIVLTGLAGSIDNDFYGTDMTIGADTALHRITQAIDALSSTAASHQRTFVVEVMGRNCGYLALMSALATGADAVFIPEQPPEDDEWPQRLCDRLRAGRLAGRRDSIVVVAEGAHDRHGRPISSSEVRDALERGLAEEVRLTILGHVQRGGAPSAFDRTMSTLLGHAAVEQVLAAESGDPPQLIGVRNNRIQQLPLAHCVEQSEAATRAIAEGRHADALRLRGGSFSDNLETLSTLLRSLPSPPRPDQRRLRIAVLHSGAPAPGMNTAVRAAVRLGLDAGHVMLGVRNGLAGLLEGRIDELGWMSVRGWTSRGGCELGINRKIPTGHDYYTIARTLEDRRVDAMLIIGGWTAYETAFRFLGKREAFPAFNIPMLCLPATINNNLPGSELSVGADTALNSIVEAVDKIKQSAVASNRCFVVEVMGRYCGYLALMGGLSTGAERVYLHEEGVSLADLKADLDHLVHGFKSGKRLGLIIRNEETNSTYTTPFMARLFEEEGGDLFEVRQAILGHLQQGGSPTPFDRILATRLAKRCINHLIDEATHGRASASAIGLDGGTTRIIDLRDLPRMVDAEHQRPLEQWWLGLRPIARILAQPGPRPSMAREL
ncbi:MAG: 6-phosphofructokinase [Thermoanaerobaculales bacterium]|jgi:6-phosphofructokinase 1|nr:6-phosphofructokinase [Thermoanaerobaculales bacterium]